MGELGFTIVWGKQFRYILPLSKRAKKLLKRAKVHPSLYTEGDVKYAKMIKRKLKNAQQLEVESK